jgi:S-adenosylmethionine hydrolase
VIALTTDFGLTDPWVGIMKGVIATRAPGVPVVDVSHGIPPQDVLAGALVLRQAAPWFPPRTIHVAVVDPGVGSARRALCVETERALFVGPDNGLLSLAAPEPGVRRIVELTDERFFLKPRSRTFHGRDVFAPVAAALATGVDPTALGTVRPDLERLVLPEPRRLGGTVSGEVIYVDRFGNLTTNLGPDAIPVGAARVRIGAAHTAGVGTSYAAVARGALVAVVNSWGLLEIALRDGSAQEHLSARVGTTVTVEPA